MFETTNTVLDDNNSLWSGITAFADAVTRAKSGVNAIRIKQGQQLPTGDTTAKRNVRDTAEQQGLVIGGMVAALAAKTNNADLGAQVDFDRSSLDKMAISDLITALKSIQTAATANAAVLASDYGVSAADLTAFGAAITALDGMKDAPRQATVNRKTATMSLPELITSTRSIYRNELDKMMEKFKTGTPDFYKAYFAARVIIDRTGSHKSKKVVTPTPLPATPPAPV